jgi:hypothetical protein
MSCPLLVLLLFDLGPRFTLSAFACLWSGSQGKIDNHVIF